MRARVQKGAPCGTRGNEKGRRRRERQIRGHHCTLSDSSAVRSKGPWWPAQPADKSQPSLCRAQALQASACRCPRSEHSPRERERSVCQEALVPLVPRTLSRAVKVGDAPRAFKIAGPCICFSPPPSPQASPVTQWRRLRFLMLDLNTVPSNRRNSPSPMTLCPSALPSPHLQGLYPPCSFWVVTLWNGALERVHRQRMLSRQKRNRCHVHQAMLF